MKMELFNLLPILCLLLHTLCMSLVGGTTCGALNGGFDGNRYRIDLQPSDFLLQNKDALVRWFMAPVAPIRDKQIRIITNDLFTISDNETRLYVLVLNASTYGTYFVDCFLSSGPVYSGSNRHDVNNIVLVSTTFAPSTVPSTDQTKPRSAMTGTTIIVVSVCALLIALIIAATILLIMRKNMKHRASRLINQEDTSAHQQRSDDAASVYDEIDMDKHSKRSKKPQQSVPITVPSKRPGQVPVPPCRGDLSIATAQRIEDDYAIIDSYADSETGKPRKSCSGANSVLVDTCVDYSTVVKSNKTSENVNVIEYAQVKKALTSPSNGIKGGDSLEFTVTFPGIDCNTINTCLPAVDMEYRTTGPTYSNLSATSKLQRSQKRKSRVKSRELQMHYAALDHSFSESPTGVQSGSSSTGTVEDNQKCQYASIDFERQAFVAPIRKAPSSWFRRKR
ncbi:uncharacterized protein LOC127860653 [Dreissena polymorpha]|uniref:Uncharacterized protein n=1 Tax=Dreissena polymorpha TaxID=45954 RepID=A0A9D3YK29_DREPO|nr:uncharacterized protein LOC127860653 [Dreissena polymorpha]KAH3701436.1 hypothetical protein DPMN_076424 [Dreissena polymorpha]